jgi:AcrR family transcriptional regulator
LLFSCAERFGVNEMQAQGTLKSRRPSPEKPNLRLGRPRDNVAKGAILKAANAILEEQGIAGFTIEAVATRASVAKTTIYRWWPSKGALAIAGLLTETAPKISYPNSGSAVADLTQQLKRVATVYGGTAGRVLSAIIADGQRDPNTIAAFIEGYARPRREEAKAILRAGIERGEFRPDIDLEVALDALYGPIYYRMLIPIGPLDPEWAESLAAHVLTGLVARSQPPPKSPVAAVVWRRPQVLRRSGASQDDCQRNPNGAVE